MSLLSSSKGEYCGLDIGTTGVRVVQLQPAADHPVLLHYGQAPLDGNLALSDSPIDQDKVAAGIAQLLKDSKVTATKAVAGIPSSQVFATVITTPKLAPAELAKAIKLQADQYIPMAVDQVKMDWHIIGPGTTDQQMRVLLVAAPNSVVNKYLKIIEKAGLELEALEVNAIAQARSLLPLTDIPAVILDLGATNSSITVVAQGAPQLIRSVNVGGTTLVKAVGQALGLDDAQADQFTRKFGLTQTKLEGQVAKAIKPSLDTVVGEIDKSIKFFASQGGAAKLEKLILTGSASLLPELANYVANATGLPVELGNPWVNISYPAAEQATLMGTAMQFSVASGLALRSLK